MTSHRPPYGAAGLAAAAALLLYGLTLAPTTAFWDASEYIATAHILGIPHPPGNPLFVVLARSWEVLLAPFGLSVPVRVNLLAAVTSAGAVGFFFLVAHRILLAFTEDQRMSLVGAGVSAVLAATAFTVWNQSTVNEKVYTLSVLIIAAATWLTIRWADRREEPGSLRLLLGALYLLVLGSTNHLMSVLPLPALGLFLLLTGPTVLLKRAFWVRLVPLVVVGLSFNFFLPVRAAQDPVINEGDPVCEEVTGAAVAVFTLGRSGCPALASVLTRAQYAKPPIQERQAPFRDQMANWFQYFDWQWARGIAAQPQPGNARLPFTLLFMALGLWGFRVAWGADRTIFAYLVVLGATLTGGLVVYLNFRYGYSLAPGITDPSLHEVRERDYFFIAGFMLWGVLAGLGLTGVWRTLSAWLDSRRAASPVLLVALVPFMLNLGWAQRNGDWAARDWAFDLLMSVEPYGVLFTNGDNDTFPLWYLQEVEGIRQDVTVVVTQYLYTSWYPKQLRELTLPPRQRPYGGVEGRALWGSEAKSPGGAIVSLSPRELDRVGRGRAERDYVVPLGDVAIQYPAGTELDRAQRIALAIIRDSIGERPIYFASSGGLLGALGMGDWGVRHGLVFKLVMGDPEDDPDVVRVAPGLGGDLVDVERSLRLLRETYLYRGLRDRAVWAERATLNVPFQFYVMHVQAADAAEKAGRPPELVSELLEDARAFLETARGGREGTPPSTS